jgi:hypothetical protein
MMRAARGILGAVLLAVAAGLAQLAAAGASDAPRTVCTVTLNSADEARALRARLPPSRYRFVELVQRDRADWLRAACASPVRCDVLVVSGHFNAGEAYYAESIESSDQLEPRDLPAA